MSILYLYMYVYQINLDCDIIIVCAKSCGKKSIYSHLFYICICCIVHVHTFTFILYTLLYYFARKSINIFVCYI